MNFHGNGLYSTDFVNYTLKYVNYKLKYVNYALEYVPDAFWPGMLISFVNGYLLLRINHLKLKKERLSIVIFCFNSCAIGPWFMPK